MNPLFVGAKFRWTTAAAFLAVVSAVTCRAEDASDLRWRIESRDYPSVFQAWSTADNLKSEPIEVTYARHDLAIVTPQGLGIRWNNPYSGLADGIEADSIAVGLAARRELLKLNPHLVLIAEIRYRDAPDGYLPEDHRWWKRPGGKRKIGWSEPRNYYLLNFANPEFRACVAAQARAAVSSGVFDGVFLDWWTEDDDRIELLQAVREAIGPNALILVNSNDRIATRSAPYVNGLYMECPSSTTEEDWGRISSTLLWAEVSLRRPTINCVETWFHRSRQDLSLMRATTTLALTMSNGYCLFCDPDPLPTPDHLHDWYDFWERRLGRPQERGFVRRDGAWERAFAGGTAIYNPIGNKPVTIRFDIPRRRASTAESATVFTVPPCDGDLFLLSAAAK